MAEIITRFYFDELLKALQRPKIIALVGARQTGKTTLLKQLLSHLKKEMGPSFERRHLFLNFDFLSERQDLASDDRLLEKKIEVAQGGPLSKITEPFYIFIDEVQKYPPVLEILKRIHDAFSKQIKIIVTGSSALQIREKGAESLAGRIEYHYIFPFTFFETRLLKEPQTQWESQKTILNLIDHLVSGSIKKDFLEDLQAKRFWSPSVLREDEEDFFVSGLYPEVVAELKREEKFRLLKNYITTYVERDVRNLTQVGDWLGYHRLLEVLASRVGQLVDFSGLGSVAGLDVRTVKKYISLLEETFIVDRLPSYFVNMEKRVVKSPKIVFCDNGIISSLRDMTSLRHYENNNSIGSIFENAILAELIKYLKNRPLPIGIYFWRLHSGSEVDCVLESENRLIPIEIKWSETLTPNDWSGLKAFQKEFKNRCERGYVFYRGREVICNEKESLIAIPYFMLFC
ncbi:MAG: ATP-binding protein [Deltaproteobacteria bacterium]|nr:ATP-binding protein [Deltaproteobacteria bacterium]